MKRNTLIYLALTLLLVVVTATSALAVFPNYKPGMFPRVGDGEVTIPLLQGWCNNNVAWYFCTDTNDVRYAEEQQLTLAPKLSSALDNGARPMYIVLNYNNSGPVFSTCPTLTNPTYSGLWEVRFIYWNEGVTPHVIKNTRPETKNNPFGLPSEASEKITISSVPYEVVDDEFPRIVVDCPIVAVGSLGQPAGNPRFGGIYRIPQVLALNSTSSPKTITLPTFNVYCSDNITFKLGVARVIIPDVQDPNLAKVLGANVAPGLRLVPFEDTQRFLVVNWQQTAGNGGTLVVPPSQYPIVQQCPSNFFWGLYEDPSPFSWQNTNFEYSPIGRYTLLNRIFRAAFPGFTDKTLITTPDFVDVLLDDGLLRIVNQNTRINAPQIPLEEVDGNCD